MRAQVNELAGYTARVAEMLDVFGDMREGKYTRSQVVRDVGTGASAVMTNAGSLVVGAPTIQVTKVLCAFVDMVLVVHAPHVHLHIVHTLYIHIHLSVYPSIHPSIHPSIRQTHTAR